MVDVRVHEGLPDGELAQDWHRVSSQDPVATVFQQPSWLTRWTRELGDADAVRTVVVSDGDDVIGFVPLELDDVDGGHHLRLLGGEEVSDYLGPVAMPGRHDEVAAALLHTVAAERDWHEVVLGGLAEELGWPDRLRRAIAGRTDLVVATDEVDDVCPRVDLTGGHEAHLDRLDGEDRREQGRKLRRLAREVGELEEVRVPPAALDDGLDTFFELASGDEGDKGAFFRDEAMRSWFRALADELGDDGTFRLDLLLVGGLPASALVSLVRGREWGLYNSAFDGALAAFAPGMVHVALLLEQAAQDHGTFDLLRGAEAYKYRFGAQDRTLARLTLTRS